MKHKILVVDDESAILQEITNILSDSSYKIMIAPNGRIACEIATQELPDLILMDWVMPEMSGIDAIKQLKSKKDTKDIPVLMVTAQTSSEELKEGLEVGAMDYIRKPIDKIELQARVKNALSLYEAYKLIEEKNKKLWKVNLLVNEEKGKLLDQQNQVIEWLKETEEKNKKLWKTAMVIHQEKELAANLAAELKKRNEKLMDLASDISKEYKSSIKEIIANNEKSINKLLDQIEEDNIGKD